MAYVYLHWEKRDACESVLINRMIVVIITKHVLGACWWEETIYTHGISVRYLVLLLGIYVLWACCMGIICSWGYCVCDRGMKPFMYFCRILWQQSGTHSFWLCAAVLLKEKSFLSFRTEKKVTVRTQSRSYNMYMSKLAPGPETMRADRILCRIIKCFPCRTNALISSHSNNEGR